MDAGTWASLRSHSLWKGAAAIASPVEGRWSQRDSNPRGMDYKAGPVYWPQKTDPYVPYEPGNVRRVGAIINFHINISEASV